MNGQIGVLNVGAGDTKLSFDPKNPADCIRAARIVKDMIRRGYALLIEVDENGVKINRRVFDFDESRFEYIIADFDPLVAADVDKREAGTDEKNVNSAAPAPSAESPTAQRPRLKKGNRAVSAHGVRGTAVPHIAGG